MMLARKPVATTGLEYAALLPPGTHRHRYADQSTDFANRGTVVIHVVRTRAPWCALSTILALSAVFATPAVAQLPPPLTDSDFHPSATNLKVRLGRALFYDKVLSGNENISCATCHHGLAATGDGLSLPVGEGGNGLGVTRDTGFGADAVVERVPRNAPPLFNLGATEVTVMFHDGRLAVDASQPSGFFSPAGDDLPLGLDSLLAAQAMFPVTSATEMAGQGTENEIAEAADDLPLLWERIAVRIRAIPVYANNLVTAFGLSSPAEITYVHVANCIAAFEAQEFRSDSSPFDAYLAGNTNALTTEQVQGMQLFYGAGGCASCHSGPLLTDHDFHAVGVPQVGPGKGDGPDGRDDFGRERVTSDPADRFKFRTPSLRNVALTGPWGHDGAFDSLRDMVVHHANVVDSLRDYDCERQPRLPSRPDLDALDCVVMSTPSRVRAIANANVLPLRDPTAAQIRRIMSFLLALTDPKMIDLRSTVPSRVGSGLPLQE